MRIARLCCLFTLLAVARDGFAALTASFVQIPISAAAIAADPSGFLNTARCFSLQVTNTDGHWASAGVRLTLPAGHVFYHTPASRLGGDFHPNPAFFPLFPDLEYDTYVSSPRNQSGVNAPAVLGPFPENDPPQSFGGASDPVPGRFSVAWGDPSATTGPGPGTYEIARFVFHQSVLPEIHPLSQTSQVSPDMTILIVPEPAAAGLLFASAAGILRRRGRCASVS